MGFDGTAGGRARRRALRLPFFALAALALLLLPAGCGAAGDGAASPPGEAAPAPSGAATAAPAAVELVTPAPTPAPTADPLCGRWTAAEGALALTLLPDGGFLAEAGGAQAAGTYTAANGVLTLLPDGRDAYAVRYSLDGASLLLMQDGQEALPLIREEETP